MYLESYIEMDIKVNLQRVSKAMRIYTPISIAHKLDGVRLFCSGGVTGGYTLIPINQI